MITIDELYVLFDNIDSTTKWFVLDKGYPAKSSKGDVWGKRYMEIDNSLCNREVEHWWFTDAVKGGVVVWLI